VLRASVEITGATLTPEDVWRVAHDPGVRVALSPLARQAVERARSVVEAAVERGDRIYGVTTGFGRLAEVVISPGERRNLQANLVRSHASGVGEALPEEVVRAILLLRANALARGHSGCRPEVVERLVDLLNRGLHPVVPSAGSVGASGDLAPLAHVALALMGEGEVTEGGERRPASEALEGAGIEPLRLEAKEGLALINGTQVTTGMGVLALLGAEAALEAAECAGALTLEALRGTPEAFRAEVHRLRPQPGQVESARRLRALLRGSEIRESHRHGDPRVQDAYALRCMPQVHGAARQALGYVRAVLETEINSVTDNPLIFPDAAGAADAERSDDDPAVVSAGNFHAQVVSQALDLLCIVVADLASISERRTERILNPDLSGLPAFLAPHPGLESGFMITQVTAVDLLAELRVLAHPSSVDSVPTSANQEDHVSMGFASARKALRAAECAQYVVAVELLCGAEALEHRRPLRSSRPVEAIHAAVRDRVRPFERDRSLSADLESLRELVASGTLDADRLAQPRPTDDTLDANRRETDR
jgi:histidine ammonia-lyase